MENPIVPRMHSETQQPLTTMSICYGDESTLDKETNVVYERSIADGGDLLLLVHHCEHASHGRETHEACIFYKGGCDGR